MNPLPYMLLGAAALLFVRRGQDTRQLVKGQSYVAVLELPNTGITVDQLAAVLPDGTGVQLDGRRAVVTFTAVRSAEMTDIPTPLGTIRVVSVRRVSDVVGALDKLAFDRSPAIYVFGGYYKRPDGMGLKWSGWSKPVKLTWAEYVEHSVKTPWIAPQAYRWDPRGNRWARV